MRIFTARFDVPGQEVSRCHSITQLGGNSCQYFEGFGPDRYPSMGPIWEVQESLPCAADMIVGSFSFWKEFGYFGQGMTESVGWAARCARGKPFMFSEYLEAFFFSLGEWKLGIKLHVLR
jgi:hypothetical protein